MSLKEWNKSINSLKKWNKSINSIIFAGYFIVTNPLVWICEISHKLQSRRGDQLVKSATKFLHWAGLSFLPGYYNSCSHNEQDRSGDPVILVLLRRLKKMDHKVQEQVQKKFQLISLCPHGNTCGTRNDHIRSNFGILIIWELYFKSTILKKKKKTCIYSKKRFVSLWIFIKFQFSCCHQCVIKFD